MHGSDHGPSDVRVTAPPEEDTAALTVPEAARTLRLSERKIWLMVKSGEMRSFKVGKSRRIPAEEIPAYIARQLKAA